MENYKEKYEKAVEEVRNLRDLLMREGVIVDDGVINENLIRIFPELKESEDEKIRKELIRLFHSNNTEQFGEFTNKQFITWLEKQGEQNPVETVAPKFKYGDWVINNNSGGVYQVTEIRDDEYCLWPIDAEIMGYLRIIDVDNDYHLWSIEDAKDGDVLFHSDSASNGIFIFKEIIDRGFAKEIICYCDYDSEDHFCLGEHHTCCWTNAKILHPATKEQRDLLFKKMKDAGYEWHDEKKGLKKIEQKSLNDVAKEFTKNKETAMSFLKSCGIMNDNGELADEYTWKPNDEHYELEEFAKIVRGNLTGISKDVQKLFEAKYLQLTGNKMYGGYKD